MNNKILKGSIIVLILALAILSVSTVSADSNSTTILTLSKGGIVINYPSDWGYSEATSPDSIMAISKLSSIDSAGVGQVNINVEKRPIEGGDFYTFVNDTYKSMQHDTNFKLMSSGAVMLGDIEALQYMYTSNINGTEKEHKAVWFEKGGQAYVLLYSAPVSQFESNMYVFDFILSDIRIT